MNRVAIYAFYSKDGIVDKCVDFFLDELSTCVDRIVIVSNGPIDSLGVDCFSKYTKDIVVRENKGLDIWGYKSGLEYIGWDVICKYDEVVLLNNTIMGPVYPFSEMFDTMCKKELDFWGITKHEKCPDPFGTNPYGYLPDHIQSYFTVLRNRLLVSEDFKQYWEDLPMLNSYEDAIGKHETYFTKYFSDKGFNWDVYININADDYIHQNMIMVKSQILIEKYRCPIFKKRSFFQNKRILLDESVGESARELMKYLKNNTDYDIDYIWENLIRTCYMSDIIDAFGLAYILQIDSEKPCETNLDVQTKVLLCLHLNNEWSCDESFNYAKNIPENADVIITTSNVEYVETLRNRFSSLSNNLEVRQVKNPGGDVSAILVECSEVIIQYDLVCFCNDKEFTEWEPYSIGKSVSYDLLENTLSSKQYVKNIITTFQENKRLGLLAPPRPIHGAYHFNIGLEWGDDFDVTEKLYTKLNLSAPISNKKYPISSTANVFWARPKSLLPLLKHAWRYEDFAYDSEGSAGYYARDFEKIYQYVVQDTGYYSAYAYSSSYARQELLSLREYVVRYNQAYSAFGVVGTHSQMIDMAANKMKLFDELEALRRKSVVLKSKRIIIRLIPRPIKDAIKKLLNR